MNVINLQRRFDLSDVSSLTLDLSNPRPKDVLALVEAFEEALRANPTLGPLPVTTGWNDITPEIGVNLLQRNRPGANRRIDSGTVLYYGSQMARGQWKATGQPILITSDDILVDAQHRLYGGLVSGVTFRSYVVTDIEPIPHLFAYIDNARPRTAATALQTAGFDGVAALIVRVVKIAEEIQAGVYNPAGATRLARMAPADVLDIVNRYPNAQKAAAAAASDWSDTVEYLGSSTGRKEIVAYLGMRIIDLYNEEVADTFFEELTNDGNDRGAPDDPITALRKVVDKDKRVPKPMRRQFMLAALIKAFNAWQKNEPLGRRWMLQVNEDFPALDLPRVEAAA